MPTELTARTKPNASDMTVRTKPEHLESELWSEDYQPWGEDKYPWQNENTTLVPDTELTPRTKPLTNLTPRTQP